MVRAKNAAKTRKALDVLKKKLFFEWEIIFLTLSLRKTFGAQKTVSRTSLNSNIFQLLNMKAKFFFENSIKNSRLWNICWNLMERNLKILILIYWCLFKTSKVFIQNERNIQHTYYNFCGVIGNVGWCWRKSWCSMVGERLRRRRVMEVVWCGRRKVYEDFWGENSDGYRV